MKVLSHLKVSSKLHSLPKLKSSMTIYLMLMLVIIMALVCTLIESGRVSAIHARLRSITYMSADSVFAEFAQPLFDRYGVMMLWMEEGEFTERFNEYVTENLDLKGTGAGMDLDLYGMRFQGSELKEAHWIVDQNGKPFQDQVFEYMKLHAAEGLAESLLARSDYASQSEKVREIAGKLNQYQDEFAGVETTVSEIYEKTQKVKDLSENSKSILTEIEQTLNGYENGEKEEAETKFSSEKQKLSQAKEQIAGELNGIQAKRGEYEQNVSAAKEAIQEMQQEVALEKDELDPEVYQALQDKMKGFSEAGDGNGGILKTFDAADAYLNTLNGIDTYLAGTGQELSDENISSYRQLTSQYKSQLEGFDLSLLGSGEDLSGGKRADSSFIRKIRKKYDKGLLDLIAGEISEKAVNRETFPSVTCKKDNSSTEEDVGIVDKSVHKALFCEYIREHFGCYTQVKADHVLDYEMEYILGGKDNDRDNLSSVVGKLVLLRSGMDLLSLMLDSTKQAEAHELALSIVGFSGQLYLVKIAEMIILTVWALAEAMIDVQQLLKDKKVPLVKQASDFYFSLEGIKNFTGNEEGGGPDVGLTYQEYLLILLLMQNQEKQLFRTMDVIQANMCDEETENFRIKECLVGISLDASFTAPGVFAALPIVRRTVDGGGGTYSFTFTQEYAY